MLVHAKDVVPNFNFPCEFSCFLKEKRLCFFFFQAHGSKGNSCDKGVNDVLFFIILVYDALSKGEVDRRVVVHNIVFH